MDELSESEPHPMRSLRLSATAAVAAAAAAGPRGSDDLLSCPVSFVRSFSSCVDFLFSLQICKISERV